MKELEIFLSGNVSGFPESEKSLCKHLANIADITLLYLKVWVQR